MKQHYHCHVLLTFKKVENHFILLYYERKISTQIMTCALLNGHSRTESMLRTKLFASTDGRFFGTGFWLCVHPAPLFYEERWHGNWPPRLFEVKVLVIGLSLEITPMIIELTTRWRGGRRPNLGALWSTFWWDAAGVKKVVKGQLNNEVDSQKLNPWNEHGFQCHERDAMRALEIIYLGPIYLQFPLIILN